MASLPRHLSNDDQPSGYRNELHQYIDDGCDQIDHAHYCRLDEDLSFQINFFQLSSMSEGIGTKQLICHVHSVPRSGVMQDIFSNSMLMCRVQFSSHS